jgi:hypothetical protein
VYLWVDGIHLGIRLGEGKLCLLVMIGVRAGRPKELVALVRAGATVINGRLVEPTGQHSAQTQVGAAA